MTNYKPWLSFEIKRLKKYYPTMHTSDLLEAFPGRSKDSIYNAASINNIKRQKRRVRLPIKEMVELKQRRKDAQIDLESVAQIMGFSSGTISNLEHGKVRASKFHIQCYKDTLERLGA